jgi:hypothetical protein
MYSQVRLPKIISRLLPRRPRPTQALNRPGSSPNWRDSRGRGAAPTAPDQPRRSQDPRDVAGGFPPALGASRQGLKMGLGGDLPSIGKAGRQQRRPDLPPHRRQLRRLDLLPNRGGWKFAMRGPPSSERHCFFTAPPPASPAHRNRSSRRSSVAVDYAQSVFTPGQRRGRASWFPVSTAAVHSVALPSISS